MTVVVIMTAIYWLLLLVAKIPFSFGHLLIVQGFLLIELSLLTAVAIAFGVFTSSILAALLSFGIYIMGHISSDLLKLGEISKNKSIEALTHTVYVLLPDLERLNLKNDAVYGLLPSATVLFSDALYGLLYTFVLLMIAIAIFSRRQF